MYSNSKHVILLEGHQDGVSDQWERRISLASRTPFENEILRRSAPQNDINIT